MVPTPMNSSILTVCDDAAEAETELFKPEPTTGKIKPEAKSRNKTRATSVLKKFTPVARSNIASQANGVNTQ